MCARMNSVAMFVACLVRRYACKRARMRRSYCSIHLNIGSLENERLKCVRV